MALSILKELLQGYEKSLFDEGLNILSNLGIINDQFSRIQALKSADNPDRVIQLINAYSVEVEAILSELRSCIDLPDIDFSKLAAQAHNIEEKSMCVGAEHVRRACTDLIQACEQKHKGNFSRALTWLQYEFSNTQNKFGTFAQDWDTKRTIGSGSEKSGLYRLDFLAFDSIAQGHVFSSTRWNGGSSDLRLINKIEAKCNQILLTAESFVLSHFECQNDLESEKLEFLSDSK